ncbi:ring-1,2-phenylacetyl-CoA epoxidase subunit PaaD [Pseudoduganella flava]|uniref:Phenylacetate-CoA oxygenase subunit PaaJ n=1 Tax=Pseudoduganella flava TaxID=871742 RepID=A0A562PW87_9BURK|nr:1,2-phenylacetyl-CoA epoxidase subunit PaaD [Pseudoduganella flava]QGZ39747.1 phenylacetate-CoA oxygenase subunit PaaJ [Pseudoduganella flava]TWI48658.1 ring-1,2-phenylacetyl-CoA epoxidase subunit PaaD [Pseudoduganella flava]
MNALLVDEATVWSWLAEVPDPEIPVISVVDLGIVRGVAVQGGDAVTVTITPTYSGCPAMQVIESAVREALHRRGVEHVHVATRLSPAWTTDWMSESGKAKLTGYGIAPPAQTVQLHGSLAAAVARRASLAPTVACPHCGSTHTEMTSQFGSTPCKALYRCLACREPFDYFKCH